MEYLKHIEFILVLYFTLRIDISLSVSMTTIFGRGFCLTGTPSSIVRSIGPGACVRECSGDGQCVSVNYWLDEFVCEFFSIDSTNIADYFNNVNCIHYNLEAPNSEQTCQSSGNTCPFLFNSVDLSNGGTACILTAKCQEPITHENALVLDGKNTYQSQRQCECQTQYTTVPADVITCQSSLTWTEETACKMPIVFSFEGSDRFSFHVNEPWERRSGSTPSVETGPSGAHDGSYYMYFETSWVDRGTTDEIISNIYFTAEVKCLEFYYCMYGVEVSTLKVQYLEEGSSQKKDLWNITGNTGTDQWFQAKFPLDIHTDFKLIFEANKGGYNFYGDIAVDYIVLSDAC